MSKTYNEGEINGYRQQVSEVLGRKYVDHSLLLGINNIIISKFSVWISEDIGQYYKSIEIDRKDPAEVAFNTIKLLDVLWSDFHYPIIKLFQLQHASLFNEVLKQFESSKKTKSQFKPKPVEMRKLHVMFVKFVKKISGFYHQLLEQFSTKYNNPLVPLVYYQKFAFKIANQSLETENPNFQANVIYLIHRCLLCLGDLSRHRTHIELTYYNPSLSAEGFFDRRSIERGKLVESKINYERAMDFYKYCILLLPALNEPYNHFGMIYNSLNQKFAACCWFLRSQLTRLHEYELGFNNLHSILKKKWFVTRLVQLDMNKSNNKDIIQLGEDINTMFICLVGYFMVPETYKNGPLIVKNLKFAKVEQEFFKMIGDNFNTLISQPCDDIPFFSTHLLILTGFISLSKSHLNELKLKEQNISDFSKFAFGYIDRLLMLCSDYINELVDISDILMLVRLILNWFKENKSAFKLFRRRKSTNDKLAILLNAIISWMSNKYAFYHPSFFSLLGQKLSGNSRPKRPYYFKDDFHFRDLSIIKYQFKDFNDSHLFEGGNIDLLVGDYSSLKENGTYSFAAAESLEKWNSIFSNDCSLNHLEDESDKIKCLETTLTVHAVVLLGKKLFESNTFGIGLNHRVCMFEVPAQKEDTVSDAHLNLPQYSEQKPSSKQDKGKTNGNKKRNKNTHTVSESDHEQNNQFVVPDSLQEIESFINQHASNLESVIRPKDSREEPRPDTLGKNESLASDTINTGSSTVSTAKNSSTNSSKFENIFESRPSSHQREVNGANNSSTPFGNYAQIYGEQSFNPQTHNFQQMPVTHSVPYPGTPYTDSNQYPHLAGHLDQGAIYAVSGFPQPPDHHFGSLHNFQQPMTHPYLPQQMMYPLHPNQDQVVPPVNAQSIPPAMRHMFYPTTDPRSHAVPQSQQPKNQNRDV